MHSRTVSARDALNEADRRAHAASQITDAIHVLTALLSLPGCHERDFKELGIDRNAWGMALNEWQSSSSPPRPGTPPDFDPQAPGNEPHVTSALNMPREYPNSAYRGTGPCDSRPPLPRRTARAHRVRSGALEGIAELKKEGGPELCAQVVAVESNAWHASDANL